MTEKIGGDILGYQSTPRMTARKKKELDAKLKEEKTKKEEKGEKEDKQKLPDLPIPNDQHTPKPGENGWDKIAEETKEQDVRVSEHVRGRPKRKEKGHSSQDM
jgi:hypothetical protein